ncbi:hypothetical protein NX801_24865 [Streptomyces sp. LP05-1]|uniref:DUF8175 domain-containing protein n=1 Tax=Streptomyces pyxinae TaxID=2970734 RepID=A0ABT2CN14_9ACTN|nr:hypothetical protein [Streptomyces sp. LP05-1]MCS0638831.1 hypothetical protein [Streptomyces sp. LP05-1]
MSPGDEHGGGRTRTRMPDSTPGDAHGTPRRPARGSRSLIMVVGVVVLLVAAIAFANRGDGDRDAPSGSAKDAGAAPTAATGTRPVTGRTGTLPTGYAHTPQGAQSAAANYAVALGSAEMFDKDKRDAVVDTVIAPAKTGQFRAGLDRAYTAEFFRKAGLNDDGTAPAGLSFVSRTTPIGTKTTSHAGDKATVEAWCVGIVGLAGEGSTKPVTSSWFTITMQLQWAGNDWKVTDYTQKDGPSPVGNDTRVAGADEIAAAVDGFGGFTYAR